MTLYHVAIDTVANDPVDVRAGGPPYLGFDFYFEMDDEPTAIEEAEAWFRDTLAGHNNIPVARMQVNSLDIEPWSIDRISEHIADNVGTVTRP